MIPSPHGSTSTVPRPVMTPRSLRAFSVRISMRSPSFPSSSAFPAVRMTMPFRFTSTSTLSPLMMMGSSPSSSAQGDAPRSSEHLPARRSRKSSRDQAREPTGAIRSSRLSMKPSEYVSGRMIISASASAVSSSASMLRYVPQAEFPRKADGGPEVNPDITQREAEGRQQEEKRNDRQKPHLTYLLSPIAVASMESDVWMDLEFIS